MKLEGKAVLSLLAYQSLIGLTAAKNSGLRIPNRKEPTSEGRRLKNFECTLLIKAIKYDGNHSEEIPECLLPGETLPRPFANIPDWLKKKFDNDDITSSADSLSLSEAVVRNKKIYIPPQSKASLVKGKNERGRRLQGTPSPKTLMAMRITNSGQTQPSYSNSGFADSIFGEESVDPFNLRIGYDQCSYGELTFTEGTGNGVIDVNTAVANDDNTIVNAALASAGYSSSGPYDYVMACVPNDTSNGGSTSWIAYAYVNWYLSVYRGPWCAYPSAQMHELGHNLNLAHSGETATYDDQSGMMGYSYSSDDTPVMCFNGPKNWQLGWYSDRHVNLSNGGSWNGNVYGLSHYESSSSNDAVVIRIDANPDIYVSYNRKAGINSGTVEGGNQLLVHTKAAAPDAYGVSVLVAKLSSGGSTTVQGNTIKFVSSSADMNFAVVEIGDGQVTGSPTSAPTVSPTQSPTPPVTSSPTSAPTVSPTQSPTPPVTSSPTSAPTASPTQSPTPSTPIDCEDDPNFSWSNRRGTKTRTCSWFGQNPDRCFQKAGAIDGCTLSCQLCNLSDAEICGDSRLTRKAICNNASMCTWNRSTSSCEVA